MAFSDIQHFLKRYQERFTDQSKEREFICIIVNEETGLTIKPEQLTIEKTVIRINTDTIGHNELFIRKSRLLGKLKERTGKVFTDIK